MAIKNIHDSDMLMLVVSVQNDGSVDKTLEDLDAALDCIVDSMSDENIWFCSIDLSGKWRLGQGEFEPMGEDNVLAWCQFVADETVLPSLERWVARQEKMLIDAGEFKPIHESEDVQLCETAISCLAMKHLSFVPVYTRFLDLWDLEHGVHQNGIIAHLLKMHGQCAEVEDLLVKMVVKYGGDGDLIQYDARPFLEEVYGDFPASKLFRRMVEEVHENAAGGEDSSGERYIFNYTPGWPEIGAAADTIWAELNISAA